MEPDDRNYQISLSDGWQIQASAKISQSGREVSQSDFNTHDWLTTLVPSTVLATCVEHGMYENPYFALNLKKIPQQPFEEPWWYRTAFLLSEDEVARTVLLEFDGINYAADVWVNGNPTVTAHKARGAFRRFQYDISEFIAEGGNVLAVRVIAPKPGDFTTGFVDWNPPPPDRNMGLFRPVRLRFCDGVSLENPFVQTQLNTKTLTQADLIVSVEVVNHLSKSVSGIIDGRIETIHFAKKVHLEPYERKAIVFTSDEYPQLHITNPRLWWPHELGAPELYEMDLRFTAGSRVSDIASIRFGVRDVSDYWTETGHRGFKINGKNVLLKGAGWTDDLLLADTPEKIDAQLQYVRDMNLNCIRCEGIWGTDQTLYDLCDKYGILVMVGWSCHWEHEQYLGKPVNERYGGVISQEDIDLVSRSWENQLLWLRNHPSIYVWAVASDKIPAPELEHRYVDIFQKRDPTRPYLASTGGIGSEQQIIGSQEIVSEVSGGSGVKMLGPYAYTPPVYWYTDTQRGGAYGFNTETSPGAVVPTLESLKKMIPKDHLWPIDEYWEFHCGLNEFNNLDRYRQAIRHRYSEPDSLEDFDRKAQLLNYELMRPMFEAFRVNKGKATGVIQWMLNAAWPKMYWQLYDWYLLPTGAFYAAKKACASPQLIYNYGDNSIYLVNDKLSNFDNLTAIIKLFNINSELLLQENLQVDAKSESTRNIFEFPKLENLSQTYFASLKLKDQTGKEIADNFYWLSTAPDVMDYDAKVSPWEYYTPSKKYANFTILNSMPSAEISIKRHDKNENRQHTIEVELTNNSENIAFFTQLLLLDQDTGEPIVPIFWQDNYISLLPEETKTVTGMFRSSSEEPSLRVKGWNTEESKL